MERLTVDAPSIDLRARRRRETVLEICAAALALFEKKGVASTTVDEIAQRAGVSTRTFFRLCGSKEEAILIDDDRFEEALRTIGRSARDTQSAVTALHELWVVELGALDDDPVARDRHFRVHRLVIAEPTLLAAASRRGQRNVRLVANVLRDSAGMDESMARIVAEVSWTTMRLALDEWAHLDLGKSIKLADVYREVSRSVSLAASAPPAPGASGRMN